jgi:hypothetical protein
LDEPFCPKVPGLPATDEGLLRVAAPEWRTRMFVDELLAPTAAGVSSVESR